MLCTGHCHKGQAALLLHGLAGADLTGRKNSLIHSAEKDYRELEAFGGMDRHHFYPVSTLVPVGTGVEGKMGEVTLQRRLLAAGGLILIDGLL